MGRIISEDLRWRVVYLFCDDYNLQEISQLLRISSPTVHRILKCYRKWRCVINPFLQQVGRRKLFSGSDMIVSLFYYLYYYNFIININANILIQTLQEIIKEHPNYYLDEIVGEMINRTGKEASIPTLWRSLKFCGITRKKVRYILQFSYILIVKNC